MIRRMGRYALIDKLGQGSMGVVYKAHDEQLNRYVALKTMAGDMDTNTTLRNRFYQEARLAAKLNHPHIVRVFDLGEMDGQIFIAMELLEGKDLKTRIQEQHPIPLETRLSWMIQVTEALAFAHRDGIVHRDIKPGNIHIRESGEAVIMDFGIARAGVSTITKGGTIIGTPEYVSPEMILGAHVDQRADIFSLGVVFYELLTFHHPFRSADMATTIHRVLNEKPQPLTNFDARISPELSEIVMKALNKNVNQRYQACEEMLDDLMACRAALTQRARQLVLQKDRIDSEIMVLLGRLNDLYAPNDFLRIGRELGYDPATGFLPETRAPESVTYTAAAELLTQAESRLALAKHYIETSQQMESTLQAGKVQFAAGHYSACIEQMRLLLAYCPDHVLAMEYVEQSGKRLQELREAETDRRWITETEQKVISLFEGGDIDGARREAHRLLIIDKDNQIAKEYLNRQAPGLWERIKAWIRRK